MKAQSDHPVLHPTLTRSDARQQRRGNFFNPTHLVYEIEHHHGAPRRKAYFNSRDARKGRLPLRKHRHADQVEDQHSIPIRLAYDDERSRFKPHLRMDISFWVAVAFWWGSAVWVANGFCVWLPVVRPSTASDTMATTGAALAFIGGSIFEVGAWLGLLEAGNRGKENDFGASVESLIWGTPDKRTNSISSADSSSSNQKSASDSTGFSWAPKARWREMGYLAAAVQMFAATIFWVSTITGLPGVIPGLADGTGSKAIIDIFFWTPQVIGGSGFVISSLILTIEVQPRWWWPKPFAVGWQVGVWNLVGSLGFLLCGALGYSANSKAIWQSDMSTYWGSWAFLIGSTFQIYEAVWRIQ